VVGMAVAVARAEAVTTVDKATGRVDVKREEMRGAEVEEDTTAAAGRLSDHLLTLRTLRQIELAPSDIAVIVLTIIGAIVDRMTMMQLQIRDQTAIAQPTFTIGSHRSRLLSPGSGRSSCFTNFEKLLNGAQSVQLLTKGQDRSKTVPTSARMSS